jgi:hypothetical protein
MNEEEQERLEAIGEQLRAKISSKFQTSTFLAGFALTVLGIEMSAIVQWQSDTIPGLLFVSVSILLAAVVLFVAAIVRLDELTMPKVFWKIDEELRQSTPADLGYLLRHDLNALKDRMVFFWVRLTLAGTYLTGVSLVLMLLPMSWFEVRTRPVNTQERWLAFLLMFVFSMLAFVYIQWIDRTVKKRTSSLRRPVD